MLYGLYLSATGVITSAYRQDLIANNMANSETVGFKRDLASFQQRSPADQENPLTAQFGSALLDKIGGGITTSPTRVDTSQGVIEPTGNNMDAAIMGPGYFQVTGADGQAKLTRDGRFKINQNGQMTLSNDQANPVLDNQGRTINLNPALPTRIDVAGRVLQSEQPVAQLAVVDAPDPTQLKKVGGSLFSYADPAGLTPSQSQVEDASLEHSNVDAATELTALMDTQRQLEANANMIHYQDEMMGDLVNTVGKVS